MRIKRFSEKRRRKALKDWMKFCVLIGAAAAAPDLPALAQTPPPAEDDARALFAADEVSQLFEDGPIVAQGAVEAYFNGYTLRADKVIYDPENGTVSAVGNVAVIHPDGQTYMFDSAELTDDLRNGVATSFRAMLDSSARLAASYVIRKNASVHELNKAAYTACPVCDAEGDEVTPTWRIRAARVTQDSERKIVSYRHAILEIKGVPILYTPYFSHPDPSVDRQSGFLAPSPGRTTDLGYFVELPYHIALSPSYDLTIAPMYTEVDGVMWKSEWRHHIGAGPYYLQGSVINTERKDRTNEGLGENVTRWHVFAVGDFEIGENWTSGFDIARTSDDTFLRRYDIEQRGPFAQNDELTLSNRLRSNVFFNRQGENGLLAIDGFAFQGLRQTDDQDVTPFVLPAIRYERALPYKLFGGRSSVRADMLVLQRTGGIDTRRFFLGGDWRRSATTRSGQKLEAFIDMRADLHVTEDRGEGTEILDPGAFGGDKIVARALPTAGISWSWPFMRRGENATHVVEPVIQFIASTTGGNPDDILNEDSQSLEFDTASLFRANRSPGLDLWENGQRANIGARWRSEWDGGFRVSAEAGQVYRLQRESPFGPETGLDDRRSDIVAQVEFGYRDYFRIRERLRIDDKKGAVRRNEANLIANLGPLRLNADYLRLADQQLQQGITSREEMNFSGSIRLSRRIQAVGGWREDLTNNRTIRTSYGLRYRDACAALGIVYRQDFTRDRDIGPSTAVLVTFELTSLFQAGVNTDRGFQN